MKIRNYFLLMILLLVLSPSVQAKNCKVTVCTREEFLEWQDQEQKERKQEEYQERQLEYQAQ